MENKKQKIKNKKYRYKNTKMFFCFWVCVFYLWFFIFGFGNTNAFALPIITNVEPTSISDNSFVVTWSTTNEVTTSEVVWGSGGLTNRTPISTTATKYHYAVLPNLFQNTTYQYRIRCYGVSGMSEFPPAPFFPPLTFTTLERPTGEYLFSFAVLNDLRYAEGKANTVSSRGIPYELCAQIISSEVADINRHGVAFTVLNGNLAESSGTYGDQIGSNAYLKGKLDQLTGASDFTSNIAYKYLPVTGYQDKKATYSTDWITNGFKPLTSNTSIEAVYGYNAASKDADSIFNYQFSYKYYNFIFLDSVKRPADATGSADLATLYKFLSAESDSKTFIFMSYPAYNPLDSSTKDYPLDIPTTEVGGSLYISNHEAFRATIESFRDTSVERNPIVAAVISGHLGDNYKRDIPLSNDPTKSISYIRQGPALQYPTGYSIYKVYSTGYVKTFYKTTGRSIEADGDLKPYFEYARDLISEEVVSGQSVPKEALTQFWLGSNSNRNFTYQYAFIPGLGPRVISTGPASNETAVSLNSPILITFNKRMPSAPDLADWVTIKDSNNNPVTVSSASFIDANQSILKVTHPDFTVDTSYEVTVIASKAKDEGLTTMEANYVFRFDTFGGKKDDQPPTAYIYPLLNNSTTDPFQTFIGIATDESRVITVQYRFDNTGNWSSTEAVDGKFTGSTEVFQIKPASPLSDGSHSLWIRTSDGAGNVSTEGFAAYSFTVATLAKPNTTSFKVNENVVNPGDPLSATPKIEVTITSPNSLESGRVTIDSTQAPLIFIKVDNNYYATYEVTTPLSDGIHGITVEAFDVLGNATTYEVYPLYVQSAAAIAVQGVPLSYPNPYDPGSTDPVLKTCKISYILSKPSNITLSIHDLSGTTIVKKSFSDTEDGGRAGYNEVAWDGKSDTGAVVGNGIYIYLIIADGRVLAKGKLTVIKR